MPDAAPLWTSAEIAAATGGTPLGPAFAATGVTFDSREVQPGDLFVALAAYGDYALGYIGTEVAYSQGGYETGPKVSLVSPSVERVLMDAIKRLLRD